MGYHMALLDIHTVQCKVSSAGSRCSWLLYKDFVICRYNSELIIGTYVVVVDDWTVFATTELNSVQKRIIWCFCKFISGVGSISRDVICSSSQHRSLKHVAWVWYDFTMSLASLYVGGWNLSFGFSYGKLADDSDLIQGVSTKLLIYFLVIVSGKQL